jgi:hypothetical protein
MQVWNLGLCGPLRLRIRCSEAARRRRDDAGEREASANHRQRPTDCGNIRDTTRRAVSTKAERPLVCAYPVVHDMCTS